MHPTRVNVRVVARSSTRARGAPLGRWGDGAATRRSTRPARRTRSRRRGPRRAATASRLRRRARARACDRGAATHTARGVCPGRSRRRSTRPSRPRQRLERSRAASQREREDDPLLRGEGCLARLLLGPRPRSHRRARGRMVVDAVTHGPRVYNGGVARRGAGRLQQPRCCATLIDGIAARKGDYPRVPSAATREEGRRDATLP